LAVLLGYFYGSGKSPHNFRQETRNPTDNGAV
jgi:hypothetical protein